MNQSTESNISTDGSYEGLSPNPRKLAGSYQEEEEEGEEVLSSDDEDDGEELNEDDEEELQMYNNNSLSRNEQPNPGVGNRLRDGTRSPVEASDDEEELTTEETDDDDDDDDSDDDVDDSDEEVQPVKLYDPNEYTHLLKEVSPEIQNLFSYILDFQATKIILEPKLLPFIPEYIPAVGELDPFLKPPRPDGKEESLGLTVLDEPCLELSNPTIVKKMVLMKRKKIIKKRKPNDKDGGSTLDFVDSIQVDEDEDYTRFEGKLQNWISEIENKLHKEKPNSKITLGEDTEMKLPDIESLMKPWDDRFDKLLNQVRLPSSEMDMSLEQYSRIILSLLDIPIVDGNLIPSLRLLFMLYGDFKKNSAFEEEAQEKMEKMEGMDEEIEGEGDD